MKRKNEKLDNTKRIKVSKVETFSSIISKSPEIIEVLLQYLPPEEIIKLRILNRNMNLVVMSHIARANQSRSATKIFVRSEEYCGMYKKDNYPLGDSCMRCDECFEPVDLDEEIFEYCENCKKGLCMKCANLSNFRVCYDCFTCNKCDPSHFVEFEKEVKEFV